MKIFNLFAIFILVLSSLSACSKQNDPNTLLVGTISGPETDLMIEASKVAQDKYKLKVKIIEFSDYSIPNRALADKSIDANMFQHKAYLDQDTKTRGFDLVAIAKTFVYPMGIYSKKFKTLGELPEKALIAIPNDPSNEGRALLLLERAKLITLQANAGSNATPKDIASNPHKFRFTELDAAFTPRALDDAAAAVINTNYAVPAGLLPKRDAIFTETQDSPYANLLVVRTADRDKPQLKQLVQALHSKAVLDKAKQLFKGQAIPAWDAK